MIVVGLDLSLTETGIFSGGRGEVSYDVVRVRLPKNATELERIARLHQLSVLIDQAVTARSRRRPDLVVLEGYSYGSENSHAHSLGELGGVVKTVLFQREIPFVSIPPRKLKKYATDNGNASKDIMLAAAIRNCSEIAIENHNVADAYWLWHAGASHLRDPQHLDGPAYRRAVLDAIAWPQVRKPVETRGAR